MLIAIVMAILVVASVLFHFLNPWQATPIASNWGTIDTTLAITFLVCGVFFVAIMVFMVHCLIKYRHKENSRASYEPESKKLEIWLTVATSIGICAMLAPGLIVYGDFVTPPKDAKPIEVLGQQWRWAYRFPGEDGELGTTSVKHIDLNNPFGINPNDPNGQDDILIQSAELHLPIDQPTLFLLRSTDVLHNYYVPQFRAKMDLIPGIVSSFWATPNKAGKYEALCAELCGVGHYNMRGSVVVESQESFNSWLDQHPTFASTLSGGNQSGLVDQGEQLAQNMGCLACHSTDGSKSLGPGWKNLYGSTETLSDGSTIAVDDAYIAESIRDPGAKLVEGYPPVMAAYEISDEQMAALIAYTQSLGENTETGGDSTTKNIDQRIEQGKQLAQSQGCLACHSIDGSKSLGPSWLNLYGKMETLSDGSTITVDDEYLRESITSPNAKLVEGYPAIMTAYPLNDEQLNALVAFTRSLSSPPSLSPSSSEPAEAEE